MGEGFSPNRHITFIVAKKSLIYSLFCSIYDICRERELVEKSEYCHIGEEGV